MGIKEINSLVKNLFQTGLKAFPPRRTRRKGVSKARGFEKQNNAD